MVNGEGELAVTGMSFKYCLLGGGQSIAAIMTDEHIEWIIALPLTFIKPPSDPRHLNGERKGHLLSYLFHQFKCHETHHDNGSHRGICRHVAPHRQ